MLASGSADKLSVSKPSSTGKDSRKTPRYRCHGSIEIQIGGWRPYVGRICNLSLQGCLIEPTRWAECNVGDRIQLRFQVNRLSVLTECIVRSVRPGGGMGVEILQVGAQGRQQLLELMQELAEPQR
jgi:PilZ domain